MQTAINWLTFAVACGLVGNIVRGCDTTRRFDEIESLLHGVKAEGRKCTDLAERKALK